jgi:hypothetical protein
MNNLKIEKKPFSETLFFAGTYSSDVQWEDEYETENYEFTVTVTHDNENQQYHLEEIIWVDKTPRNVDEVDDYINEHFFEITGL